uniref:Uncharacterized protein n=1 Tax=Abalone asfa-like virus TaxID=2839893 RepID=A0A5K7Y7X7_9VIRU|nr:hypothetical protein [Abalone asfa-like virus]
MLIIIIIILILLIFCFCAFNREYFQVSPESLKLYNKAKKIFSDPDKTYTDLKKEFPKMNVVKYQDLKLGWQEGRLSPYQVDKIYMKI